MRYLLRRPRAFWISAVNLLGLTCSVIGVVLLFWYALPNEPPGGPERLLLNRGGGPEWEAQRRLYDWYAHWGLALVLIGTVLEAVPPFCTALGSWGRRLITPTRTGHQTDPASPMKSTKRAVWPLRRGTPYWNDQLKLIATFFNNLVVAFFIGIAVAPYFANQKIPLWTYVGGGFFALVCLVGAHAFLREIEPPS
jgi:hypothetical protein